MAFVVDGSEWRFDGVPNAEVEQVIEAFLSRISCAFLRGEEVWIGEDFQSRPMVGDMSLWDLWSPQSPIRFPVEIWEELAAWLSQAPLYADSSELPEGIDDSVITVADEPPKDNMDVAWAHHNIRAGLQLGCLSLNRCGVYLTASSYGSVNVRWIKTEKCQLEFWRSALEGKGGNLSALDVLVSHAFPSLYFQANVIADFGNLAGGYAPISRRIREFLAMLNDQGAWIFSDGTAALTALANTSDERLEFGRASNQMVERRFAAQGFDIAPENPDVRKSIECRRAREIEVAGDYLYCEWHFKVEPHRNRIHIHPPVDKSGGKVIVAIASTHLPLP